MFRSLDNDEFTTPSAQLSHFTNRVDELTAFERILNIPDGNPIPTLMFHGVGGTGKTWLLKSLLGHSGDLPSAYIDLDPLAGGQCYHNDPARLLAELRRQLGERIKCPRFDLAYTWLLYKEGNKDEPTFRGAGALGNLWEFIVEAGSAAADDVPGANIIAWLVGKVTSPANDWLKESGFSAWLTTKVGEQDFLRLKGLLPDSIKSELHVRLLKDLRKGLPSGASKSCRAVVFLDTLEALRSPRDSDERVFDAQEMLRKLYHPESGLLLVLGGRDQLTWGSVPESHFADRLYLEQHRVGGLSEVDALKFLSKCGIEDEALQRAILKVSKDKETKHFELDHEVGYHAFSLGLCADTCWNLQEDGKEVDPETFDMTASDTRTLAVRFLRSLAGDGAYAQWLKRLALTLRFDELAARKSFSEHAGADQDFAWRALQSYSFVRSSTEPGWLVLHKRMREALDEITQSESEDDWRGGHQWWQQHFKERTQQPLDQFATSAWYHSWHLDARTARSNWNGLIESSRRNLRMSDHFGLLRWWQHCDLTERLVDSDDRVESAAALYDWAGEYWQATLGDRSANLRAAIACFEAVLRIYTETDFPQQWAMTQNSLGLAYSDLPSGDRDENLRAAVACYEAALRIYTETDFPQGWAMTQNNLGIAYSDLPSGDRDENLRAAVACYEAALRIYTETDFPQDWAMTQNNLGLAYSHLPSGDRDENLRAAIACYEAALRIRTETDFPQKWAMTQNNLGIAYYNLPSGDRDENLRAAVACNEAALRIYTETDFPRQWAMTQHNLGLTYSDLPSGDRDENLRAAIACGEAALRIRTETDFPQDWAMTQNSLGIAYYNLPSGDRDENLRAAIACYEAALRIYTKADFPQDWAMTQNNLGLAYSHLLSGDRDENLRAAVACYEAPLRIFTEADFPQKWAMTQNNLGIAYYNLPSGDRDDSLRAAIACYEAALRIYTKADFPRQWAMTQHNLGLAYNKLPSGDRDENLRAAIACYEAALRIRTEADFPQDWAMTQHNLGLAYSDLPSGDRDDSLRAAIACYEAALRIYTKADFPQHWAMTQNNLGIANRLLLKTALSE